MKKFFNLLSAVFISALALSSCKVNLTPDETLTGTVTGKAVYFNAEDNSGILVTIEKNDGLRCLSVDSEKGRLAGVRAAQTIQAVKTDKDGTYTFTNLNEGLYTVSASSSLCSERAIKNDVLVTENKTITVDDLILKATGSASGKILLDGTETGNFGFKIFIGKTNINLVTGDDGSFTIENIPAGNNYEFYVEKGDYTALLTKGDIKPGENTNLGTFKITSSQLKDEDYSFTWKGSFKDESEIKNPQKNWAYYNTDDGCSYIYDGEKWTLLASKGKQGDKGDPGNPGSKGDKGDPGSKGDKGNDAVNYYFVSFMPNGGGNSMAPQVFEENLSAPLNECILTAPEGKVFYGWNTKADGSGTSYSNAKNITITENLTLYAQWKVIYTPGNIKSYLDNLATNTVNNPYEIVVISEADDLLIISSHISDSNKYVKLDLSLSTNIKSIESPSFINCNGLTSVILPDTVTSIKETAFGGCNDLSSIIIPDSVTSIDSSAFNRCKNISSITVDKNNTKYDSRNNCNAIIEKETNKLILGCKNTIIPDTATSIGDNAFNYCTSLTSITIPNSITSIGENAFSHCENLKTLIIPNSVISIGKDSFYSCFDLTSITLSNSMTSISMDTFSNCTNLSSIVIPDSITSIDDGAFSFCSGLISITIPSSVDSIGAYVFLNCTKLLSITFDDTTTWYITNDETNWKNKSSGANIDVDNKTQNVNMLSDSYLDYYWYKL